MRKAAALVAAMALALAGCARGPLEETAAELGDVRSGIVDLSVVATAAGGERTGFRIQGPFAMPEGEGLPDADLTYTRYVGTAEDTFGFVSTGDAAFLRVGRQAYRLPDDRIAAMRGSEDAGRRGPFSGLDLDDWVPEAEVVASPDNADTETVSGELDVVTAVNDMLAIARDYGGVDRADIEGDDAEQLRRAVREARLELVTGKEDRILRSLVVTVDFGREPPEGFRRALEGLTGVNFTLQLRLAEPNSDVSVEAPANALPYERLGR
ncbi:MAG TPA: hypothetical protein VHJ78_02155 [Actinomycetota bacterium]|nr:hypothetical protein [Actinomycetota bacterium]